MRRAELATALIAAGALCLAASAGAGAIQGLLRYNGQPATSTFGTAMRSGFAGAYNWTTLQWTIGTVDVAGNSYSIPNLAAAQYSVQVRLSPSASISDAVERGGDLYGGASSVTVGGSGTVTKDLDLLSAVHIVQPLDNLTVLQGSASVCPLGPEAPASFTLAWDPVPHAATYSVRVGHMSCAAALAWDWQNVTGTSAPVTQLTAEGEQYVMVYVDAYDAAQTELSVTPFVDYLGGTSANAYWVHAATTQVGRPIHPTNSKFIAQVAHLPGQSPTFWKTDLYLTNPASNAVTAKLRFTPRDSDGTQTYSETTVALPARASRTVADVLSLFPASGAGSLEVEPAALEVSCRTYTPGAAGGTYGQGLLPVATDQLVWSGGPTTLLGSGAVSKGAFRANLALVEVWGESVDVNVYLLDRTGTVVGQKAVPLLPFGNTQINDVVGKLGGPATIEEAQVEVEVTGGNGRVAAVLSITDNSSQDPLTLPLWRR